MALTYKDSGVDIDEANRLVDIIKPLAKATSRREVMGGIGGFGAIFDIAKSGYKDPLLVSSTDGVGTKIKIAIESGIHNTIGIDLVAMCVNDILVQGAEPLFFLDYFATGRLDNKIAGAVITSVAEGCRQAGCALVGGETAEMPSMYPDGEYDLAGFAVGAVERDKVLPSSDIKAGDVVLGVSSSGLHSNGFSLVRKILKEKNIKFSDKSPFESGKTVAESLLEPTRIYIKSLLPLVRAGKVKGLAHITGGGLLENIPRVLPDSLGVELKKNSWQMPTVFSWLESMKIIDSHEMSRTLNCGIGMVVITTGENKKAVADELVSAGEKVFEIGQVIPKNKNSEAVNIID